MLYRKRYFQEYRINFRKTSETTKYFVVSKYNMRLHTAFVHATSQWYTFIREKTGITHILNFIATWLFYVNPGRKKANFYCRYQECLKRKKCCCFMILDGIGFNQWTRIICWIFLENIQALSVGELVISCFAKIITASKYFMPKQN